MSRSQIADVVRSGQLTESELRKYVTTYQEKLARPFACFVFILIAVPFGVRSVRAGGSSTSLGFGLSLAIVFVYYVVMTICSFVGEALLSAGVAVGVDAESSLYGDRPRRGCDARRCRYELRGVRSRHRQRRSA